jgi:hypothetical protein
LAELSFIKRSEKVLLFASRFSLLASRFFYFLFFLPLLARASLAALILSSLIASAMLFLDLMEYRGFFKELPRCA